MQGDNKVSNVLAPHGAEIGVPMPSSWSYGSFHPNSRFFGAVMTHINQVNISSLNHCL